MSVARFWASPTSYSVPIRISSKGLNPTHPEAAAGSNRRTLLLACCCLQPAVRAHNSPLRSVMTALLFPAEERRNHKANAFPATGWCITKHVFRPCMPQIVEVPVFRVKPSTYVNTVVIEQSGPVDIFFRCPARRAVKVRAGGQAPTSTKAADDCQQEPCRGGSNTGRGGESKQVRIASIP